MCSNVLHCVAACVVVCKSQPAPPNLNIYRLITTLNLPFSVLQRVAVSYNVLQCVAACVQSHPLLQIQIYTVSSLLVFCHVVCCSVLQCVAVCCSVLQCVAVSCSVLQCVAVCCSVLQCLARCCSVMKCVSLCAKSPATANLNIYRLTTTLTSPFTIYHFPFPIYKRSFLLNLPCGIVLLCVALGVNVGWIVLQCVAALY